MADSEGLSTFERKAKHPPSETKQCDQLIGDDQCVEENNATELGVSCYNDLECSIYQNYTASEVFVQGLAGVVNQQDVEAMIRAQKKM